MAAALYETNFPDLKLVKRGKVRDLYDRLKEQGFDPWLDEIDLIPGQIWKDEISKAIREIVTDEVKYEFKR